MDPYPGTPPYVIGRSVLGWKVPGRHLGGVGGRQATSRNVFTPREPKALDVASIHWSGVERDGPMSSAVRVIVIAGVAGLAFGGITLPSLASCAAPYVEATGGTGESQEVVILPGYPKQCG